MIETPKISEILYEEFMEPFGMSAYKLAKEIDVPVSRIQDILHDRRKITVDTSIRLGRFFGVSEKYFINLQNDIDARNARIEMADSYAKISPFVFDPKSGV
jgi:addiction module HigA family antidote